MIAVDTNVLVRFLVRDDPTQAARAAVLIQADEVWVPKTVLLETEWVLRSLYGFSPESMAGALRALAGLRTMFLEDERAVAKALEWFKEGVLASPTRSIWRARGTLGSSPPSTESSPSRPGARPRLRPFPSDSR